MLNNLQENIDHIFFLHASISSGRARLVRLWEEHGFINDEILEVSRELDSFITEYQRILMPVYRSRARLHLVK